MKPETDKSTAPKPNMPKQSVLKIEMYGVPQTWYGRLIAAIAAVLLLWLAIMFFAVFLFVVGFVFAVVMIRLFWALNKAKKGQSSTFIKTAYYVEKHRQTEPKDTKQINKKTRTE